MKRFYFLVAIGTLQIVVGSLMLYGAASPIHLANDVHIPEGLYYHYEYGILGAGRLTGNVSEIQNRTFALFVFDDAGFASFREGASAVPPLFEKIGTTIVFEVNLPGSGQYHIVFVDFPARGARQVHLDITVGGLKTNETILSTIVLAGGLALVGATLMLSVWTWRRGPPPLPAPTPPPQDPPQSPPKQRSDDDTRVY